MSEALVSVLPTQLAFARLLKTNLSRCSGGLLRILFGEDRELAFFNMTESPHEVSLVLDELSMAALRDECGAGVVEVEKNRWRAIMLCEGSDGFQQTGVVERLTGPLAAAGISLFNLSTYEADFILVREADLERTVLCLQRLFRCQIEGFDVKEGGGGGSVEEGVRSSPPASAGETKDTIGGGGGALGSAAALADKTAACGLEDEAGTAAGSGEGRVAAEGRGGGGGEGLAKHRHPLWLLPLNLQITSFRKTQLRAQCHALVQLLFCSGTGGAGRADVAVETSDNNGSSSGGDGSSGDGIAATASGRGQGRFVSFTVAEDDVSIVHEEGWFDKYQTRGKSARGGRGGGMGANSASDDDDYSDYEEAEETVRTGGQVRLSLRVTVSCAVSVYIFCC